MSHQPHSHKSHAFMARGVLFKRWGCAPFVQFLAVVRCWQVGNKRDTGRTKLVQAACSRPASGQLSHSLKPHVSFIDFAIANCGECVYCVCRMQIHPPRPVSPYYKRGAGAHLCSLAAHTSRLQCRVGEKGPSAVIIICLDLGFWNSQKSTLAVGVTF